MTVPSPNLGLTIWNLNTDPYDHGQLAANWNLVDQHDHSEGKGVQIPTGGIEDGAVTAAKIDPGAIPTVSLGVGDVGSSNIANGAVGSLQLAANSVASGNIINATIQTGDIGNNQITAALLANGAVGALQLAAGGVGTTALADSSVTSNKVATTLASYLGVTTGSGTRRGETAVSGTNTTTSTTFTALATADKVSAIAVPTPGILWVMYRANWKLASASNAGAAAIFVNGVQYGNYPADTSSATPVVQSVSLSQTGTHFGPLFTDSTQNAGLNAAASTTNDPTISFTNPGRIGTMMAVPIEINTGTYDVEIRFKVNVTTGGTLSVSQRKLRTWVQGF